MNFSWKAEFGMGFLLRFQNQIKELCDKSEKGGSDTVSVRFLMSTEIMDFAIYSRQ